MEQWGHENYEFLPKQPKPRRRFYNNMASLQISHCVIVICCLWSLYGGGESSQKLEQCFTTQSAPNHIELCHDHLQPRNVGPYTCNSPDYGFILSYLKIGPRSKFQDCGSFHTRDLLDPKCLRNVVKNVDQFDAAVFDLLEKVSGKNQIDNNTVVERFSWSTVSEDGGRRRIRLPLCRSRNCASLTGKFSG
ncbi:hypothetical protein ACOMHN_025515 [Nucella lapillus]